MPNMAIDPITLARPPERPACRSATRWTSRSCAAAFSPVIAEALDRSDGIYHRDSGELIAQGELGLPVFVGTMQFTVQAVIERVNRLKIALDPGDVFIVNDPYLGGTHLMDVKFVQPFFSRRQALVLARQHRALARHRRHGAGRLLGQRHRGRAGGAAPAAGEALQEGRARRRDPLDHPVEHPHRRPADRRHQGAGGGAGDRAGAPRGAARPLRRRDRRRGDRRAQAARGAADAREDRDDPRRRLRRRGLRRFRRRRRRAAPDRDADHEDRRQRRRARRAVVRHERLVAAVPRADEQRHRDDALVDLPRDQARLSGSADQRRHLRAAAHRRSRRDVPLRATIRVRSRAAPPR